MDLRQFRYASLVAKEKSFTRAAARLDVAQSAISDQVAKLEAEIGFSLFRREGRGTEVTELGQAFIAEVDRILAEVSSLTMRMQRLQSVQMETIRIGLGSGVASVFVPRLLPNDGEIAPGLRLDILTATTMSIFNDLLSGRIDLGIAIHGSDDRVPVGLKFERLLRLELALIAAPTWSNRPSGDGVSIRQIASEPFVMYELPIGYGEIVRSLFEQAGLTPHLVMLCDNVNTIKQVVAQGAGLAVVPAVSVAQEVKLGMLDTYPFAPPCFVQYAMYRRRQMVSRRREAYFRAILKALLGPEGEAGPLDRENGSIDLAG
ncbi:MAG TPA: LysR family transcriptional regulator [Geminicoccaceae bacterium]|nr:LysR family transcriptional regulator [Geminicoccaceae bacterium]